MAKKKKANKAVAEEASFTVEPDQPELEEATKPEEPKADNKATEEEPKAPNVFKKFWTTYKTNKKFAIPVTVLVFVAALLAIPFTRFALLGTVIKSSFEIGVNDDRNYAAVSGAKVTIDGQTVIANNLGRAKFTHVKPGKQKVHVEKKYYKSGDVTINVNFGYNKYFDYVHITALGRFVPVVINNKITGKPLAGAEIKAADTDAKTDKDGKATIVVPADKSSLDATISLDGYNDTKVKLDVTAFEDTNNNFKLVPSGKVYFLSKLSGKIDVVKTDLDGSNRQTVLAGTGNEEDTNTVLLASRDWKYLALQSRRDSTKAKLYLLDTSNDKLTEMDSGDASFTPIGWSDHIFAYTVQRSSVQSWQPNATALKGFNAETQQLATIDQTNAEGTGANDYATEYISHEYIIKNTLIYTKTWGASYYSVYRLAGKRMGIYSAAVNGGNKQLLKDFDVANNGYFNAVAAEPAEVYISANNATTSYYEYEDGKLTENKDLPVDSFTKFYPTYLLSPSGLATFWYEPRDGKNTLFTGAQDGSNGKEIASLSEYIPYGWYSDDYLLVSKNSSELYILPTSGTVNKDQILKITDYHKPTTNFLGYGGGYGGQ